MPPYISLLIISRKMVIIKIYGSSKKTYVQIQNGESQKSLEKKILSKNSSMFFKFKKNIYYFKKKLNFLCRYFVFLGHDTAPIRSQVGARTPLEDSL